MSSPSDDSDHDLCKSFTVNAKECALLLSESEERSSWEFLFKKWLYVHAESILWICVVLFFSTSPSPLHINSVKAAALTSKTLSIKVQLGQKSSSNPNPINTNYFLNWQKKKKIHLNLYEPKLRRGEIKVFTGKSVSVKMWILQRFSSVTHRLVCLQCKTSALVPKIPFRLMFFSDF